MRAARYHARVTRPRSFQHATEIAELLAEGRKIADIARSLELTRNLVHARIRSMRARLAELQENPAWLSGELKTHVQVGQAWCELGLGDAG